MAGDERPPGFDAFDARLARLRRREGGEERAAGGQAKPRWGDGLQVGIELLAGLAGGLLLGWALDRWLGTAPFLLLGGFVLGAAAGMLNAWRWMQRLEARMRESGAADAAEHGEPGTGPARRPEGEPPRGPGRS